MSIELVSDRAILVRGHGVTHYVVAMDMEKSGLLVEHGYDVATVNNTAVLIPKADVTVEAVMERLGAVVEAHIGTGEVARRA